METPRNSVPTTPENQPSRDSLQDIDILRYLFGIENVEAERASQKARREAAYQSALDQGYNEHLADVLADVEVEHSVDLYMEENGITPGHPKYQAVRGGLVGVSIKSVPDSEWAAKFKEGSTTEFDQSGMDKTRATFEEITGEPYYPIQGSELSEEDQQEIAQMREKLDALRTRVAGLTAKRQSRFFGKASPEYETAYAEYQAQYIELAKLENKHVLEEQLFEDPEQDRKAKEEHIVLYNDAESTKLREETVDKLKNSRAGKIIGWLSSGNRFQRILKGVAVGAAGAVVATGIGALAGVAGATAIGAGVAGLVTAAVRFGRGYAAADARAGYGMSTKADTESIKTDLQESGSSAENAESGEIDYVQNIATLFAKRHELDTQNEQSKRRKSAVKGLGTMAIGWAIGTTAALGISELVNGGSALNNDPFFGHHGAAATDGPGATDGADPDGGEVAPAGTDDHSLSQEWHQHVAEQQAAEQAAAEEAARQAEILANTPDAQFYIQPGEGGIHFFQRLGLGESQWYQIQNELLNRFPQDFYQNPGQAVRLQHAGQLSIEAQKYIKSAFGLG